MLSASSFRELLDAPLSVWSPAYPNVAQAELLLRNGVRDPVVAILTRIGTVAVVVRGGAFLSQNGGRLAIQPFGPASASLTVTTRSAAPVSLSSAALISSTLSS